MVHGYSQARGDFDCSLAWGEIPQLGKVVAVDGKARALPQEADLPRCARCSEPLTPPSRGPMPTLCKKCRKGEQNQRAYERRATRSVL